MAKCRFALKIGIHSRSGRSTCSSHKEILEPITATQAITAPGLHLASSSAFFLAHACGTLGTGGMLPCGNGKQVSQALHYKLVGRSGLAGPPFLSYFQPGGVFMRRSQLQDLNNVLGALYLVMVFLGIINATSVQPVAHMERSVSIANACVQPC